MNWNFSINEMDKAISFFKKNGFVGFDDLLSKDELESIKSGIKEAVDAKKLVYGETTMVSNQDIIFAHPIIEQFAKDHRICEIAKNLIDRPIELQHSKFNVKPTKTSINEEVKWHQDFPFYPHTNFDLVSCVIHLDDEDESSGPLRMIPESHTLGVLSHCKNGEFVYECTESIKNIDSSELLTCKAGHVGFHHALTLHNSDPRQKDGLRRLVIYQYRAQDAIQLAGVVWKCAGYQVTKKEINGKIRFPDGTVIENRGDNGKLIDIFQRYKPDKESDNTKYS